MAGWRFLRRNFPGLADVFKLAGCAVVLMAAAPAEPPLDLSHFKKTFSEHFTGLDVSPDGPGTRWIAHTPWHGDFGDAAFDNPGPDGPFTTGPNGLTITAHQDKTGKWHGGLLSSAGPDGVGPHGFAQRYGYFEIKCKLPDGPGVWPAFWLVEAGQASPAPEIDVFEYYGAFPKYFRSTEHLWVKGKDGLNLSRPIEVQAGILSRQFNSFGVLIEPDQTKFYFNRKEFWTTPTPAAFRQPLAILVDLALGGGWPIKGLTSPQAMEVQYIDVYQTAGG